MWKPLGGFAPGELTEARLQAQWASQIPAAAGRSLLEPAADYSHTSLEWRCDSRVLASAPLTDDGLRAGLCIATLRLVLLRGSEILQGTTLDAKSVAEGLEWLTQALSKHLDRHGRELRRPEHELPSHAVGDGAPFALEGIVEALAELEQWLDNADGLLRVRAARLDGASAVRCWPHHLDIATLVTLEASNVADEAKSIGLGLSLGDDTYAEPYFYVTPWPYPEPRETSQPLPSGHWHTEKFFAAVLTGSELTDGGQAGQAQRAEAFLEAATAASRGLLGTRSETAKTPMIWHEVAEVDELPPGRGRPC